MTERIKYYFTKDGNPLSTNINDVNKHKKIFETYKGNNNSNQKSKVEVFSLEDNKIEESNTCTFVCETTRTRKRGSVDVKNTSHSKEDSFEKNEIISENLKKNISENDDSSFKVFFENEDEDKIEENSSFDNTKYIENLENKIEILAEENSRMSKIVSEKQMCIENLQKALSEQSSDVSSKSERRKDSQLIELEEKIIYLERELNEKENKLKKFKKKENKKIEFEINKIKMLEEELEKLRSCDYLNEEIEYLRQKNDDLLNENDKYLSILNDKEKEIEEKQEIIDQLNENLNQKNINNLSEIQEKAKKYDEVTREYNKLFETYHSVERKNKILIMENKSLLRKSIVKENTLQTEEIKNLYQLLEQNTHLNTALEDKIKENEKILSSEKSIKERAFTLEKYVEDLLQQIEILSKQNESLGEKIRESSIVAKNENNSEDEQKHSSLITLLYEKNQEIESLKKEISNFEEKEKEKEKDYYLTIEGFSQTISEKDFQINHQMKTIQQLEIKNKELENIEKKISTFENEKNCENKKNKEIINELNTKIKELNKSYSQNSTENKILSKKVKDVSKENENLIENNKSLIEKNEIMVKKIDGLEKKLNEKENENHLILENNDILKSQLKNFKTELENKENDDKLNESKIQNDLQNYENKLLENKTAIIIYKRQNTQLAFENEQLTEFNLQKLNEIKELTIEINSILKKISNKDKKVSKEDELEKANKQLKLWRKICENSKEEVKKLFEMFKMRKENEKVCLKKLEYLNIN